MGLFDFLKPLTSGLSDMGDQVSTFLNGSGAPTPGGSAPGGSILAPPPAAPGGLPVQSIPQPAATMPTGDLQSAPQMSDHGGGFLDRLREPDARGVTMSDRLMAMGSVLQGDGQGAANQLRQVRQDARQARLDDMNRQALVNRSAAFKAAMATGKFDPATYAQVAGNAFDPDEMARMEQAFRHENQFMSGPNGAVYSLDATNPGQPGKVVVPGQPKPPGQFIQGPDGSWQINPQYVALMQQVAHAKRVGAPPVGRAAAKPKSYSAGEVTWQ